MKKNHILDFSILGCIYIVFLIIQIHSIGKLVYVSTDEGVYLYASKLIEQGLIPYKDFFLDHLPFLMYSNAIILKLLKFDLNWFHYLYSAWVLSSVIPIYLTVLNQTKNRIASTFSAILFVTFTEMVQWDAHFFAIRQCSLPFLAFAIFFATAKKNNILAAISLSLFSFCLLTNTLIAVFFLFSLLICDFVLTRNIKKTMKKYKGLIFLFAFLNLIYFLPVFLIKNSFAEIVSFQNARSTTAVYQRLNWLVESLKNNGPILIFGAMGTLFSLRKFPFLGLFTIGTILIVLLCGKSYYLHYIVSFAVPFSITGAMLFTVIPSKIFNTVFFTIGLVFIYFASFATLKYNLIDNKSENFFTTINYLRRAPDPLFTFEPIYALYANKNITFFNHVSDMRSLGVTGGNLRDDEYLDILERSNSVLMESYSKQYFTPNALNYLGSNFVSIYNNGTEDIYVRSTLDWKVPDAIGQSPKY